MLHTKYKIPITGQKSIRKKRIKISIFPFFPTLPTLPVIPPTPKLIMPSSITNPPCIIAIPKLGILPFIHSSVAAPNDITELAPNAINAAFPLAPATPAITGPKYATPNANDNPNAPPTIALFAMFPQSNDEKSQPFCINCFPASKTPAAIVPNNNPPSSSNTGKRPDSSE